MKTRQAILQTAAILFRENGFGKTSIEELARASGIGKGTIYCYFQSKSDIINTLLEDNLARLHKELIAAVDREIPFLQQMVKIYLSLFRQIIQHRECAEFFIQQVAFPRGIYLDKHQANENNFFRQLLPLLERAKERGELRRDIDLFSIAEHFHWLYLLLICAWYNGRVLVEDAEMALEALFCQAIEGLQPRHPL